MRNKLLVYFGCVLLIGGALALGWYGYLQFDTFRIRRAAGRRLDVQTAHKPKLSDRSAPRAFVVVPPRSGEAIGRIEIPRLHISVMVLEGTAPGILRVAAGHIKGTALPGITGNIGIAAHRDTFFRPLREVRPTDGIILTTSYSTFRYTVDNIEIVEPSDIQILQQTSDTQLTLVTCYPFTFLGAAPKRFVVHARSQGQISSGTVNGAR
jgi:sortase A